MIRLRTLGENVIVVGRTTFAPDADVLFAVLLFLATERGRRHGRDQLADLFWPSVDRGRALHCLRQTVYKLRQAGVELSCTKTDVELPSALVLPTFAAHFSQAALEAELADGSLRLGPCLPEYAPSFSEGFSDWLEHQRAHVHAQVRRCLVELMQERRAGAAWADVDALARQCLALDALNEEATLALAESAALSGGKAEAVAILDRYLDDLGPGASDIRLPALVLRRRIAERFPPQRDLSSAERCFVGRGTQMAPLSAALRRARGGDGGAVLLWGPPGIGKTRIATELANAAALQGMRVVRTGCEETDARRTMGVWVDAVPHLMALPGALGCSPDSLVLLGRLTMHDSSAARAGNDARNDGRNEARSDAHNDARNADVLAASIRRAIVDLVDAVAGEHPLLLVLEDVHWADAASWNVVRELTEASARRRVLLLMTSRLPHALSEPPARGAPRLAVVPVGPLDADAGGSLVRAAVPPERASELTDDVVEWCLDVGEGNPFFLHELASHWGETGTTHEAPSSLQTLLDGRISSLPRMSLHVLQACALLARHATVGRLEAVLELKAHELLTSLAELGDDRLIGEEHGCVTPLHDLVAQRTLRTINAPALRLLHRRIGQVLEADVRDGHGTSVLWDCARHWSAAGEARRALDLLITHAYQVLSIGCGADALETFERALLLCTGHEERRRVLRGKALALKSDSRWQQAAAALEELVAIQPIATSATTVGCEDAMALVEARLSFGYDMRTLIHDCQALATDRRLEHANRLQAATWGLICADNICDAVSASVLWDCVTDVASSATVERSALAKVGMIYHASFGDVRLGAEAARSLRAAMDPQGPAVDHARTLRNVATALRYVGDTTAASEMLRDAYRLAAQHGIATGAAAAAEKLACLALDEADLRSAAEWLDLAGSWARRTDDLSPHRDFHMTSARLALASGDAARAGLIYESCNIRAGFPEWAIRWRRAAVGTLAHIALDSYPGPVRAQLLDELAFIHERSAWAVNHDMFAYVYCRALAQSGFATKAEATLVSYLTRDRRVLGPLPHELGRLAEQIAPSARVA